MNKGLKVKFAAQDSAGQALEIGDWVKLRNIDTGAEFSGGHISNITLETERPSPWYDEARRSGNDANRLTMTVYLICGDGAEMDEPTAYATTPRSVTADDDGNTVQASGGQAQTRLFLYGPDPLADGDVTCPEAAFEVFLDNETDGDEALGNYLFSITEDEADGARCALAHKNYPWTDIAPSFKAGHYTPRRAAALLNACADHAKSSNEGGCACNACERLGKALAFIADAIKRR